MQTVNVQQCPVLHNSTALANPKAAIVMAGLGAHAHLADFTKGLGRNMDDKALAGFKPPSRVRPEFSKQFFILLSAS